MSRRRSHAGTRFRWRSLVRRIESRRSPAIIVLAGSNGAGKTTFYQSFLAAFPLPFVNADLIARSAQARGEALSDYAAAVRADAERRRLVAARETFVMETVLSDTHAAKLGFFQDARAAGYTVYMIFIGLEDDQLSRARVMQRVEEGGHDVPEDRLIARFPRTLANLRTALRELDCVMLVDNSYSDPKYRYLATVERGRITDDTGERPRWTSGLGLDEMVQRG